MGCDQSSGSEVWLLASIVPSVLRADLLFWNGFAVRRALAGARSSELRSTRRAIVFRVDLRQRRGNPADLVLLSVADAGRSHPVHADRNFCRSWHDRLCNQSFGKMMSRSATHLLASDLAFNCAASSRARSGKLVHSECSLYREVLVYEAGNTRCMCFTRYCRIGRQTCMDVNRPVH